MTDEKFLPNNIHLANYRFTHNKKLKMIILLYYCWVVLCTVKDIEETRDHVSDPIRSHTARISVCNTLNTVGRIKYHSKGVALKFLIKKRPRSKDKNLG
jgi:hypothetical protein